MWLEAKTFPPGAAVAPPVAGEVTRESVVGPKTQASPAVLAETTIAVTQGSDERACRSDGRSGWRCELCSLERPRAPAPTRARRFVSGSNKGRDTMRKSLRRLPERLRAAAGFDRPRVGGCGVRSTREGGA